MIRSVIILSFALPLSMALGSCNTTGCTENQNSVPLADFYSYNTGEPIALDSISVGGLDAPGDSLLAGPSGSVSSVYLPFRSTASSTTFIIKYLQKSLADYGVQDQLTFYYESHPWFASEECGAMYNYRITRVSHTYQILDSVGLTDSLVTNIDLATIRLYFRTSPAPEEEVGDE